MLGCGGVRRRRLVVRACGGQTLGPTVPGHMAADLCGCFPGDLPRPMYRQVEADHGGNAPAPPLSSDDAVRPRAAPTRSHRSTPERRFRVRARSVTAAVSRAQHWPAPACRGQPTAHALRITGSRGARVSRRAMSCEPSSHGPCPGSLARPWQ